MWIQAFAYGKVLARPVLTLLERELLAVSILTALGHLEGPLLGHMRACVRLGATPDDVAAALPRCPTRWARPAGTRRRPSSRGSDPRLGVGHLSQPLRARVRGA